MSMTPQKKRKAGTGEVETVLAKRQQAWQRIVEHKREYRSDGNEPPDALRIMEGDFALAQNRPS